MLIQEIQEVQILQIHPLQVGLTHLPVPQVPLRIHLPVPVRIQEAAGTLPKALIHQRVAVLHLRLQVALDILQEAATVPAVQDQVLLVIPQEVLPVLHPQAMILQPTML